MRAVKTLTYFYAGTHCPSLLNLMVYSLPKSWVLFCCSMVAILSPLAVPTNTNALQPSGTDKASPDAEISMLLAGQKSEKILVTIDPGHGGKDPGAIGLNELREVDVILPIALRVAKILEAKGVATQLTRDSDFFVGLDERVNMSRKAGASIFVSIHANSIDNRPDVNGLETYHYHRGLELATSVHRKVLELMNDDPREESLLDRGVRSARFLVLRKSEIPAILVEVGYLTSPTESPKLADAVYRDRMAEAIAQGILDYLGKGTTTTPISSNKTPSQLLEVKTPHLNVLPANKPNTEVKK
jgi:N-acetylmuramoyl-L-alanine amidase